MTLTFKVATQMFCATRYLNMVIIPVKYNEVVKADSKKQSYGADTILLQGHDVTLTFKVLTQMLFATRRLNMVIIYMKSL